MTQTTDLALPVKEEPLAPFGLRLEALSPQNDLTLLPIEALRQRVARHRLLVLRGFRPFPSQEAITAYAEGWGPLLRWEFGFVFEVLERADAQNYLFTAGSVPYHWDGAFAKAPPWLQIFQCLEAPGPGAGGETLFCDTPRIWAAAAADVRTRWERVSVTYATEKRAHYGGRITAPLVGRHPHTGEHVLRFAEPANETTVALNTPEVQFEGLPPEPARELLAELRGILYDPRYVYAHEWRSGDIVVADNHALLHGRSAYRAAAPRRLWRVHVL